MLVKVLVLFLLVSSCVAWLAPERCAQHKVLRAASTPIEEETKGASLLVPEIHAQKEILKTISTPVKTSAVEASNIAEIAAKQHETLLQTYKDRKFVSVPIRAVQSANSPSTILIQAPFNCSFITKEPRLLSSVACDTVNCKLSHTVITTDSYTASEGYNWGVKISSKGSFFGLFEIGGEVSTGGTYSCSYNKGRSTSDLVECSDNTSGKGNLLLYNVKSDMICDFGQITLELDMRDGMSYFHTSTDFTFGETQELYNSQLANTLVPHFKFMIDMDKISDRLLNKIKSLVPLYNPYTDFLFAAPNLVQVFYFKETNSVKEYRRVIPFTNENGDAVYQYACTKQPL